MSRTFTNLLTHLIFGTKGREPFIDTTVRQELHAYLGGLTKELNGKAYGINGTDDHVHMLVSLPPVVAISDALRFIKANSSGWIHEKWPRKQFAWQPGYGAFSVSKSNVGRTLAYIGNQESHHQRKTFREEYVDFLRKHEIEFDERYLL